MTGGVCQGTPDFPNSKRKVIDSLPHRIYSSFRFKSPALCEPLKGNIPAGGERLLWPLSRPIYLSITSLQWRLFLCSRGKKKKKKNIYSSFFYLFPFEKYLLCRAANIVGCDMWRGKSSLAVPLWWNILKRILTKEGLSADVYAEGEREKEKRGRERRRERERKDWACRGREALKSRVSGQVFQRGKK